MASPKQARLSRDGAVLAAQQSRVAARRVRMTAESTPMEAMPRAGDMPSREGDFTVEGHGFEPIPESARYGSVSRVFTVWFTPNLVPAAFFIGTLVTLDFLQLGFIAGLLAIIVGNLVG